MSFTRSPYSTPMPKALNSARDLQPHLGYVRRENFQTAINRAMGSCEATGHKASDHFRGITKMIQPITTEAVIQWQITTPPNLLSTKAEIVKSGGMYALWMKQYGSAEWHRPKSSSSANPHQAQILIKFSKRQTPCTNIRKVQSSKPQRQGQI